MVRSRTDAPRVAFQGEPGAFSEDAVLTFFDGHAVAVPCRDFDAVGAAVLSGDVAYGVLPVENSLAGSVVGSYDVLARGGLAIVGEIVRPIRHCLLGVPGATTAELGRIISHPVALAQCTRFLAAQPAEAVAVYDTAGAAREVAERGDPAVAAVASRVAAERYGLAVLAEDIQDRMDNQTRFFVVTREDAAVTAGAEHTVRSATSAPASERAPGDGTMDESSSPPSGDTPAGNYKTALLLETENRPGALVDVLLPFSSNGINLTKLESRPAELPWRYRFFLELETDASSAAATRAIDEIRTRAVSLRMLGSFPCWARDERA